MYVGSILLIVSSVLAYQLAQKFVPHDLNPWHALVVVYAVALAFCVAASLLDRSGKGFLESMRGVNLAVPFVGVAAVGIELGWILAFRAGWQLSITGLVSNVTVALLVAPIGLLFFKDKLGVQNLIGMALCLIGLSLVLRKAA
jgi:uncharacterized membrane protein